VCKGRV